MDTAFPTIPDCYSKWLKRGWSTQPMLAQVAAEQDWEDEGGSAWQPAKPQPGAAPKLPL